MTSPSKPEAKVSIFLRILSNASSLLSSGVLGTGDVSKIVALIQFAANVVRNGDGTASDLREVNTQLQALNAAGRGPTDAEWAAWEARDDSADARWHTLKGA